MNEIVVQSMWIGDTLSMMERLSIASLLKNGHPYQLYVYQKTSGVPEGVIFRDANRILPAKYIFTYHNGSYAGFADWFRWELLYQKGGYWVDTDIVAVRPFTFTD
jgi:hypothetical protein